MKQIFVILSTLSLLSISANAFTKKELGQAYNKIGKASSTKTGISDSLNLVIELAELTNSTLPEATGKYITLLKPLKYDSATRRIVRSLLDSPLVDKGTVYNILDDTVFMATEVIKLNHRHGKLIIDESFGTVLKGAESDDDFNSAIHVFLDLADVHVLSANSHTHHDTYIKRIKNDFREIYGLDEKV